MAKYIVKGNPVEYSVVMIEGIVGRSLDEVWVENVRLCSACLTPVSWLGDISYDLYVSLCEECGQDYHFVFERGETYLQLR